MLESYQIGDVKCFENFDSQTLKSLIAEPLDLLIIDSNFYKPSIEPALTKIIEKTNTKIILTTPKSFPSIEADNIDGTLAKPLKRSSVLNLFTMLYSCQENKLKGKKCREEQNTVKFKHSISLDFAEQSKCLF